VAFNHFFNNNLLTLIYGISLPTSGFFAYYYWHKLVAFKANWMFNILFKNKQSIINNLVKERESIVYEFEQAQKLIHTQL
jgi:hypothetical protein